MKTKYQVIFTTLISMVTSVVLNSSASAAGRTFWLNIVNVNEVPVEFTILKTGHNCYEPEARGALGTIVKLRPGGSYGWWINRVQGHGCDGNQGVFQIKFSPVLKTDAANRDTAWFTYDNAMHLAINRGGVNQYRGKLIKTASDKYQYRTSGLLKKIKATTAYGEWKSVCDGVCNRTTTKTVTTSITTAKSLSREETNAISLELQAGVKSKVFSASSKLKTSHQVKVGRSMSDSFTNGETNTDASAYVFTPEQMRKLNIQAVWQWVVPMSLSNGKRLLIRSNIYTCTSNSYAPKYYARDPKSAHTCNGALARK